MTEPITFRIEADAARVFKSASRDERQKVEALVSILLQEYANSRSSSLKRVMDEIGEKARQRGLTPEILTRLFLRPKA